MTHANLSAMHRVTAERLGDRVAIRHKRNGLYHDLSWRECRQDADLAARGLIASGVEPGDRVAILSENRVEWVLADLAILASGAVGVPMHAPLSPRQIAYQLTHSGAVGIFLSGREQAEKLAQVIGELPELRFVIAFDSATTICDVFAHHSWAGLRQLGQRSSSFAEVLRRESAQARDHLATIIYTSGTTGLPKGVILTHGNLLSNAEAGVEIAGTSQDDVVLSWLPYSHIYARTCDLVMSSLSGATLCLAESIDALTTNLAEIRPSCMSAVPRFYEKVWANIAGLPIEHQKVALRTIFGPRVRHFSSGGAPLPKQVARGFDEAGMTLMEGYGLTESSPIISFNTLNAVKVGTVGRAIPKVEIRIADDGEVLTRGPHVMKGYWRDEDSTRRAIVDEWLHTGDLGELDADGYLSITGRKKDLIITSGGKNVSPSELERLLTSDTLIEQAVVCGDARPFISALIVPDFAALEKEAAAIGCPIETQGEMIVSDPIRALFAGRIESVMKDVSNPERVKEFLLLARPFRVEDEEVTATMKVRRTHILAKHAQAIDALYRNVRDACAMD